MAGEVVVLVEHFDGKVDSVTFQLLAAGRMLADHLKADLTALACGRDPLINELCQVEHFESPPLSVAAAAELHDASLIVGHDRERTGCLGVVELPVHQALADAWVVEREGSPKTTTDLRFGQIPDFMAEHLPEDSPRGFSQTKRIQTLTRIVVRNRTPLPVGKAPGRQSGD